MSKILTPQKAAARASSIADVAAELNRLCKTMGGARAYYFYQQTSSHKVEVIPVIVSTAYTSAGGNMSGPGHVVKLNLERKHKGSPHYCNDVPITDVEFTKEDAVARITGGLSDSVTTNLDIVMKDIPYVDTDDTTTQD